MMKQKTEVVSQLEYENGVSIGKDNIKVKIDYKKENRLTLMKPSFSICLNPLESWFYFESKQGLVKGQILSTKLDSMTNEELICTMSTGHEVYVSELIPCLDEQTQP